ncbi:MAG: hypothetical protein DRJ06_06415 [Candidatus Aminicenantes bacterium]|nr:MAG: hypothetical protein DRJ06_06415 [Candidatus Aminicenantes bacterium]
MKKKILIIITILFLTTTLGVFAVSNFAYSENTEKTKATCNPDTCPPNGKKGVKAEYIRMQIPIPGVTHTCTYHPDPEANELKPCYYVEANLPLYIKKIYNFAIGVIAIIAVVMIMIGGLQWIFAAGNPGTISQAKSNITAAVSGLILALASYVILNTINPSLVELKMQMPEEIGKIEQASYWCEDSSIGTKVCEKGEGKCVKESDWTDVWEKERGDGYKLKFKGKCGEKYEVKKSRSVENSKAMQTCWGSDCDDDEAMCYYVTGLESPRCFNVKTLCESMSNNCDSINSRVSNAQNFSCRKYRRDKWWDGDCKWGMRWPKVDAVFKCNAFGKLDKFKRVPCAESTLCSKDPHCTNDNYANIISDNICVLQLGDHVQCQVNAPYPVGSQWKKVECSETVSKQKCSENCWAQIRLLHRSEDAEIRPWP